MLGALHPMAAPRFAARLNLELANMNELQPAEFQDLGQGLASEDFRQAHETIAALGSEDNPITVKISVNRHYKQASVEFDKDKKHYTRIHKAQTGESYAAFFKKVGEEVQAFVDKVTGEKNEKQGWWRETRRALSILKTDVESGEFKITADNKESVNFTVNDKTYQLNRRVRPDGSFYLDCNTWDSENQLVHLFRVDMDSAGKLDTLAVNMKPGTMWLLENGENKYQTFDNKTLEVIGKQTKEVALALETAVLPKRVVPQPSGFESGGGFGYSGMNETW